LTKKAIQAAQSQATPPGGSGNANESALLYWSIQLEESMKFGENNLQEAASNMARDV